MGRTFLQICLKKQVMNLKLLFYLHIGCMINDCKNELQLDKTNLVNVTSRENILCECIMKLDREREQQTLEK